MAADAAPLVAVLAVVLAAAALLVRAVRGALKFRRMELAIPGPASLPLLGNALDLLGVTEADMCARLMRLWGGRAELSRVSLLGHLLVVASCPDDAEAVLRRKEFSDKSRFYELLHLGAARGLVMLNGADWKAHRRAAQPAFALPVLERLVDVFAEEARAFVARLRPGRPVDVQPALRRTACGIFMRTTLVEKVDADLEHEVQRMAAFLDVFLWAFTSRSLQPLYWPGAIFGLTAPGRTIRRMKRGVDRYANKVLTLRRQQLHREHTDDFLKQPKVLIDALLASGESGALSDQDILDEFNTFFVAAVDTTSATLSWVFKMLSLRPDVQDKVYAEVADVLGGSDRDVVAADLARLQYMDRFLREVLRLFPAIPFTLRQVREDTGLAGHTVPAHSTVVVNTFGVHRDPRHWPEPLRFDPDRFLPEACARRHPYAYIPFSMGPRNCIGSRYAMMNMKTVLATTLRAYRVQPGDDGHKDIAAFPLTFDLVLRLVGGVRVRFTPRAPAAA